MFTIIGLNLLLELAHGNTEDYLLHSLQARKNSMENFCSEKMMLFWNTISRLDPAPLSKLI